MDGAAIGGERVTIHAGLQRGTRGRFLAGGFADFDFVLRLGDFALEIFTRFFEFAHALAQTACEFGDFLGSEKQKTQYKDDEHFRPAQVL